MLISVHRHGTEKVITDAKDQFTLPDVVPGMPLTLCIRKTTIFFGGKPKLGLQTLKPGEQKDPGKREVELLR